MCLITKREDPEILQEDLVVYKILGPENMALSQTAFKYIFDTLYEGDIEEDDEWLAADAEAVLSLDDNHPGWRREPEHLICIGKGYHFCLTEERARLMGRDWPESWITYVECLVPKGATMYKDPSGLGVSNKIILKRKL